ncbi:hypothetical protein PQX77_001174 [Marasmius sp. AFHP31]|nr:hypothetical protein PQX77_001174 [Marasmius sp. AFHP31]
MSTNPPPKLKRPVRSHKKSRMGCLQCKKRRVKCDETQPICGNCSRRSTDCVYEPFCPPRKARQPAASTSGTREPTGPSYPPTSKVESGLDEIRLEQNQQSQQQLVEQRVSMRQQPTPAPFSTLDMVTLKLLHHYNMETSPTIAYSRQCLSSLQYAVPQMAFSNPSVMHAIMSVSALHMHRLYIQNDPSTSDRDYLRIALTHRSHSYKALAQTTDQDAHFLAMAFLGVFGFIHFDEPPDVFKLLSGVHTATKAARGVSTAALVPLSLTTGIEFPRDSFGNITTDDNFNPGYSDLGLPFLGVLHHIHLPTPNYPDPAEVEDPEISEVYRKAVQGLLDCWFLFQRPGAELTAALMWPTRFPDRFHHFLVVEKRQRALVLLYYFCFMLGWLRSRNCWWAQPFGESMGQVAHLLDERWMACISATANYNMRG